MPKELPAPEPATAPRPAPAPAAATVPAPAPDEIPLDETPRFLNMTSTIARHLLESLRVDDLERALQLYALVEEGCYEYLSESGLSAETEASFKAWEAAGHRLRR